MNLFQIATRGIDLDSAPITPDDESPREGFRFEEPAQPQQRLRLPAELDEVFALAAQEYEIDPDVLRGIAYAESRFNPDIISGKVKSKAGAIGLMQFMPETAKEYGIEPTDPTQAIIGAAAYLRKSLDKFGGDYERAVASYNWGPNRKAYDSEDWTSKAPAETQKYLQTVFSAAGRFKDGQAERGLPQGVTPSKAGAGRGAVNPGMEAPVTDTGDETARLAARYKAPRIERTYGEAVSDTGAQLVEGVNNILGAPANLVAPNSSVAQFFKGNADTARDWQSDAIKQRTATASAAIDKAGEEGIIAQVVEAAKQYSTDPALAARFVVTNLPSMLPGIGAAKLAQAASLARGATLAQAAATATTVAGGTNAVLNAGGARGEAFDDLKATLIKQGVPEAQAIEQALKGSLLPAAVGGAAGFVSGKTGIESAVVGKAGAKAAVTAGAKSAAVELGGEQFEELAPKLATNYQASQYDNRSLGKDVGRTIVETAIGSGPGSLYSGVQAGLNTRAAPTVESQPTTPQVPPTVTPQAPVTPDAAKTQAVDNIAAAILEAEGAATQATPVQAAGGATNAGAEAVQPGQPSATQSAADAVAVDGAGQPESAGALTQPTNFSATPTATVGTQTNVQAGPGFTGQGIAAEMAALKARNQPAASQQAQPQIFTGKSALFDGYGASVGSVEAGDRKQLMVDPNGGYFWGDWKQESQRDVGAVAGGADKDATPASFTSSKEARQAAASTPLQAAQTTPSQPAQQQQAKPRTKPQPLLNDTEAAMLSDFERMYQADVKGEIKTRLGLMPARQDEATAPIVQRKPSELLAAIKRAGGIKSTNAGDLMGGSAMDANRILPGLFTKGGMNLDLLVPFLKERGYLTQADEDSIKDNGGVNKLAEILQAELSGARAQTMDSTAGFESDAEAAMRSELDSKAFALGLPMKVTNEMSTERLNGVINRIERKLGKPVNTDFATRKMSQTEAMAERQAILMADRVERARAQYDADIQAFAEANDRVQEAVLDVMVDEDGNIEIIYESTVGEAYDNRNVQEDSGQAGAPVAQGARAGAGNPEADRTEAGAGQEGLTSYTPEEVTARQQATAQAEAATKRAEEAAARAEAAAKQASEIAQRSVAAADTFELGGNAEDNLSGQQGLKFSRKAKSEADDRNLIIQHNLSSENLLHAVKMGGIAVPSLAVTTKTEPLTGFGEITLIGSVSMADPKGYAGTKVFGADIYSPRYPSVTFEFTPNMRKRGEAMLKEGMTATDSRYLDWSEVERDGARELERQTSVLWQFLKSKGVEPAITRTQPKPLADRIMPFKDDTRMAHELADDPAFADAVYQTHQDMLTKAYGGDEEAAQEASEEIAKMKATAAERGRSQLVNGYAQGVAEYQRNARQAGQIDRDATRRALQSQVREANLGVELRDYAAAIVTDLNPNERIFQGFTNSGNRKYIPHTLDNVVKLLKKELRGGESFDYGVGSLRAKFTPQFKSVADIRKNKDRLISSADFDKIKDEINTEFLNMAEAMSIKPETLSAIMEDAAKMGVTRAAAEYGADVGGNRAVEIAEFMTRLRNLPTAYFEAKILRDVDLAEFAAAVIPSDASPKVRTALESRGVTNVFTYERNNEADRKRAIQEAAESKDDLVFSKSTEAPRTPASTIRTAITKAYGNLLTRLEGKGLVTLTQTEEEAIAAAAQARADQNGGDVEEIKESLRKSVLASQRAWHGTPHRGIEKFSTDKIGTGEGAQAFGYGLYFTDRAELGEYYRESVSNNTGGGFSLAGVVPTSANKGLSKAGWVAAKDLSELLVPQPGIVKPFGDLDVKAQDRVLSMVRRLIEDDKVLDTVVGLVPVDVVNVLGGKQRSPEYLLDHQTMLIYLLPASANDLVPSQVSAVNVLAQAVAFASAKVHTGLARFDILPSDFLTATGALHSGSSEVVASNIPQPSEFVKGQLYEVDIPSDSNMLLWDKPLSEQPESVQNALKRNTPLGGAKAPWKLTGAQFYQSMARGNSSGFPQIQDDRQASEYLASLGIKGIKYLDGQSRNKPLRDVKREFLAELPEDAGFDDVMALVGTGTFSPKNEAVLKALADIDWLGFDYPAQAISTALGNQLQNFDPSPELVQAVAATQDDSTYNYVVFSGEDVQIVDVKYSKDGNLEGFFDPATGKSFLIADNLTAESAPATLMHEVGIHMAADGKLEPLFTRAANLLKMARDNEFIQRVQARMDQAGETSNEEAAAYIVTEYEKDRTNAPASVGKWVKDFIADVRAWLFAKGVLLKADQLTVADIAAVARANANRMAKGDAKGDVRYSKAAPTDQTQTAAFKRWFGDSKVVDADGKPLVVMHGTPNDQFFEFDPDRVGDNNYGSSGSGFWFTDDYSQARRYWDPRGRNPAKPNIMEVYLKAVNPLVADPAAEAEAIALDQGIDDFDSSDWDQVSELLQYAEWAQDKVKEAMRNGHDSLLIKQSGDAPGNTGSGDHWVVFDPTQIKSATGNNGNFDPANPDIRRSVRGGGQRASTQTAPAQPVSKWRDSTGRLQFAPGAMLYDFIGDKASPLLSYLGLKMASPELRTQLRRMKAEVTKAQEIAATVATESAKFSEAERNMVSDLIEKTVAAGTIPPDHAVKMAELINMVMGKQTDELVSLGMLSKDSADRWRDEYLPRYYESKMLKKDAWGEAMKNLMRRASLMRGIKGKHLKGRGLFETVPVSQQADYESLGWEVRDDGFDPAKDETVMMWRDFTAEERAEMGEIKDAGFRFVMGYMQTQKDIALGRMYRSISSDENLSSRLPTDKMTVKVPGTKVADTSVNVYGELAGRYVSPETLSVLSSQSEAQNDVLAAYRKALGLWKEGKTVLNPVSHMNNVVSNITMAHFAGVSYHRVDKYIGAVRDFVYKHKMVTEAKEAGLFSGGFSESELMQSMPAELRALAGKAESKTDKAINTAMQVMTFGLRNKMQNAYGFEDDFFKYLIYKDARSRGATPDAAVDFAQQYIFTYDDLPRGARIIRDSALPFFSYTYKALPALLHTALTQPHRFAVPAALMTAAATAAYAIASGDDDDDRYESIQKYLFDDEFRKKADALNADDQKRLPPWMKGYMWTLGGIPRSIRVGYDNKLDKPVFLDVSRMMPGGTLIDVSPNSGGIPLFEGITPSHPLLSIGTAMLGNRDLFTGKDVVDKTDNRVQAAKKRADWMWKQIAPAITVGNYHYERVMNMIAQKTGKVSTPFRDYTGVDRMGMPTLPEYGIPHTFGIKLKPIDLELSEQITDSQNAKLIRELDAKVRSLQRMHRNGAVSDEDMSEFRADALEKRKLLRQGLTIDGDER